MYLVIAEKPVLAKNIVSSLKDKSFKINDLTYKCKDYYITSLQGHILEHIEPEEIDEKWKKWSIDTLPVYTDNWKKKVIKGKNDILKNIKELLKQDDVEKVINAGDMDAEGQLLVDEVLEYLNNKKPVLRLNTADTTETALFTSLNNLKDNREYKGLRDSAEARSLSDMIHGFTATRLKTIETQKKINIGRVASFVVYSVAKRDNDIKNFTPLDYTTLFFNANKDGKFCKCKVELPKDDKLLDENGYLSDENNVKTLIDLINNNTFKGEVKTKELTFTPPLPYTLLTLQKDGQKYNLKPDKVLKITQDLRDKYNAITYNRTEHSELPLSYFEDREEHIKTVLKNLNNTDIKNNFKEEENYKSKCFVESEKCKEHFGIIPQKINVDISQFTDEEKLIYTLIAKRYLMQFMGDKKVSQKSIVVDLDNNRKARASEHTTTKNAWEILSDNLKDIDEDDDEKEEDVKIPFTEDDKEFLLDTPTDKKSKTKPPKRWTFASLLVHLKNNGLGTPATRDTIVNKQFTSGYIVNDGKFLKSTPLAQDYITVVPQIFMSAELTSKWKEIQENIENGNANVEDLTQSVLDTLTPLIESAKNNKELNTLKIQEDGYYKTDFSYCYRENGKVKSIYKKSGIFSVLKEKEAKILFEKGELKDASLFSEKTKKSFTASIKIKQWKENNNNNFLSPEYELIFDNKKDKN